MWLFATRFVDSALTALMVSTGAKRASGLVCPRSDAYYRRSMLAPALRRGRAVGGARRRGGGATRPLSDAPEHVPLTNIGDRMRHRAAIASVSRRCSQRTRRPPNWETEADQTVS